LAGAVEEADTGATRLQEGLATAQRRTADGAEKIERLATGLDQGARGLERLREPAQTAETELLRAQRALERMLPTSKADPQYRAAYEAVATALAATTGRHPLTGQSVRPGYEGLDASLATAADGVRDAEGAVEEIIARSGELADGIDRLEDGSRRLAGGMDRLDAGAGRLADGIAQLDSGGDELTAGLDRLEAGGGELATGYDRLGAGAGELGSGLASGERRTARLEEGMARMEEGAADATAQSAELDGAVGDPAQLAKPLESGYFTLAALETGGRDVRTGSGFTVNVDDGGTAARISVVAEDDPKLTGHPLRVLLEREADRFERQTGMSAEVGGGAAILQDFNGAAAGRMALLVLLLCAVTWVVLVPVLRSLLLPLLAVVLNLLTVAAAFGVLVLLFQGDAPLGGAGFLDAIMVAGIFSVVFALSIDYEVFLLARMREGWLQTKNTEAAVEYGLRKTAGVVTGAAAIMLGVFVVFSFADISSMRQLGIGLSLAVLLDATIVRLVLLPAAIRLCGDRCWTLPAWLDRRLPEVDVEGSGYRYAPGWR
jgi:putative drug exporter of the RND superfamily